MKLSRPRKVVALAALLCIAAGIFLAVKWSPLDLEATQAPAAVSVNSFTSQIPVLVLRADRSGAISSGKLYSPFTLELYEPKAGGAVRLADGPTSTMRAGVRIRGMVSRLFPKQSYRLQLQDENRASQARPMLGMPAADEWVLQGPWLDKSLIRNAFSYDLARAIGASGMRTRACEVFLVTSNRAVRDSDYVGVYQLTEAIERSDERVKLAALGPDDNAEPAITGGYLLAWDVGEGTYLRRWSSIQVKYPKAPTLTQLTWIDRAITQFDDASKGPNYRDPLKGYAAHIDVDAWVNYILVEELTFNLDGYVRSFYLQKDRGGKIRPGPVWDHDLAMGHQFPPSTNFDQWWFIGRRPPHNWPSTLMSDPAFVDKVAVRWRALRQGVLKDAAIDARIDAYAAPLLSGAGDRNFARWKILNVRHPFDGREYITYATATYPEQITALKGFMKERAAWIDRHLPK